MRISFSLFVLFNNLIKLGYKFFKLSLKAVPAKACLPGDCIFLFPALYFTRKLRNYSRFYNKEICVINKGNKTISHFLMLARNDGLWLSLWGSFFLFSRSRFFFRFLIGGWNKFI